MLLFRFALATQGAERNLLDTCDENRLTVVLSRPAKSSDPIEEQWSVESMKSVRVFALVPKRSLGTSDEAAQETERKLNGAFSSLLLMAQWSGRISGGASRQPGIANCEGASSAGFSA